MKRLSLPLKLPTPPFVLLFTVPAAIVMCIGLAPIPLILAEQTWPGIAAWAPEFAPETARSVLSVIAGGAMTALALAYSMTLVVFTLAASSIGPRLLRRFITDSVSQVTAGAFGGAFLFSMITLAWIGPSGAPRLATLAAMVLGVHAVLQLVFFVRHVARNVSIDDEVAAIAKRLETALEAQRARYRDISDTPEDQTFEASVKATRPGYVGALDEMALLRIAEKEDVTIRIDQPPGRFVVEGEPVIKLSKPLDEAVTDRIGAHVRIEAARSEGRRIEFSIHLLVEIGLRALSPGVNDPYTAVAVSDALSAAFVDVVQGQEGLSGLCDESGAVRLIVPGLSARNLIGQAFHPLRRAGAGSVLLSQALARAYSRLYAAGGDDARAAVEEHVGLLLRQMAKHDMLEEDLESVLEFLSPPLRKIADDAT